MGIHRRTSDGRDPPRYVAVYVVERFTPNSSISRASDRMRAARAAIVWDRLGPSVVKDAAPGVTVADARYAQARDAIMAATAPRCAPVP